MSTLARPVSVPDDVAALAPLFRYPDESFRFILANAPPSTALARFSREVEGMSLAELQASFTSTFDLAPSCSPYLGVHLFAEEGRDRARLMVGLRERGVEGDELPDHIAEVLDFAPRCGEEEWTELAELVLVPALAKMDACLRDSRNPWRHLIAAVAALVGGGAS